MRKISARALLVLLGTSLACTTIPEGAGASLDFGRPRKAHVVAPAVRFPTSTTKKFQVIHVARTKRASNSNRGSASKPMETIQAAVRRAKWNNARRIPTKILIHPGVYRESIRLHYDAGQQTDAPLVIEGTRPGAVVISGAEVWRRGWYATGDGLYRHKWPHRWGPAPVPAEWEGGYAGQWLHKHPVILRREMVFARGAPFTQVVHRSSLYKLSRAFYVSEPEGRVYVKLPSGLNPYAARIRVAVRPSLLLVDGAKNVFVKDLVFRHAASPLGHGAINLIGSSNVMIIGCRVAWNSWNGLGMYQSSDVVVNNTLATHNGNAGATGLFIERMQFEDTTFSYNGWRAARGWNNAPRWNNLVIDANFLDFAGGHKFLHVRDARFIRFSSYGNQGSGLWLDSDISRVIFDHVSLLNNWSQGLMIEGSQGPVEVSESRICGNESGLVLNDAAEGVVTSTVLSDNVLGQIWIAGGSDSGRFVENYKTGRGRHVQSTNWELSRDRVDSRGGQRAITSFLKKGWRAFVKTLHSNFNTWSYGSTRTIFGAGADRHVNFSGWRQQTGEDGNSELTGAHPRCSIVAP